MKSHREGAVQDPLPLSMASRSPSSSVVAFHGRTEPLPCDERRGLPLRLGRLLQSRDPRSAPPSKIELGPAVRQVREDVVGRHVGTACDPVHVPSIRRTQGDDIAVPEPSFLRVLEIFENDATRGPFDDPSRILFALKAPVVGCVVRAPCEGIIHGNPEGNFDSVFRPRQRRSLPRVCHETPPDGFGPERLNSNKSCLRIAREFIPRPNVVAETMIERIDPPAPGGPPYSGLVVAGPLVFVAGQVGSDPRTGAVPAGIKAQTQVVLSNIGATLKKAGCRLKDVVKWA